MFEGTINDIKNIKCIIDAFKDLVPETLMHFSSKGIDIKTMDASHISLCIAHISFDKIKCDQDAVVGISLTLFSKILKASVGKLTVRVDNNLDFMYLTFNKTAAAADEDEEIIDYQVNLMDISSDDLEPIDETPDYLLTLESKNFKGYIDNLKEFGEVLTICIENDKIKLLVSGSDIKQQVSLKRKDETGVGTGTGAGEFKTSFTINYISKFTKVSSVSDSVKISVYKNQPLMLEYSNNSDFVKFYMAPKIDDDID